MLHTLAANVAVEYDGASACLVMAAALLLVNAEDK